MLALDTNAYRALDDGNPILAERVARSTTIGMPIIVVGEIYVAAFLGKKPERNANILRRFLRNPRVTVLRIDDDTARIFGEIAAELRQTEKPIQQNDMWIAALCKQHGYPLATNDKDFRRIRGLEVVTF